MATSLRLGSGACMRALGYQRMAGQVFRASSFRLHYSTEQHLPRVLQPSLWKSLVPRALRSKQAGQQDTGSRPKRKGWNPATIYIIYGLLIGSQAIQNLTLKREMLSFSRETEAKLQKLREVIERVQQGEDVDVEAMLGTGDLRQEKEWEEAMRELELEDDEIRVRRSEAKPATKEKKATTRPRRSRAESGIKEERSYQVDESPVSRALTPKEQIFGAQNDETAERISLADKAAPRTPSLKEKIFGVQSDRTAGREPVADKTAPRALTPKEQIFGVPDDQAGGGKGARPSRPSGYY